MNKENWRLVFRSKHKPELFSVSPPMSEEEARQIMWEIPQKQKDGDKFLNQVKGAKIHKEE